MRKILTIISALIISATATAQVISIAAARNMSLGQSVTVSGVVTTGSELGGNIRYMQDGTAGIAAFGVSFSGVNRYDSITVSGILTEFNGLLEIGSTSNPPTFTNHGPAVVTPQPITVPLSAINESVEGQLITINNITFVQTGNFASGNSTVQVTNGPTTLDVRINGTTNIDGTAIPSGTRSITGVVGQFNTNYQIIPRALNDIVVYVAPQREINVLVNNTTRLTGSTIFLGAATSADLVIENLGVGNLTISNVAFSGAQSAAFSTNSVPAVLGPESVNPYTITITPSAIGTHNATLTISSDDNDESEYVLHFEAGGTDGLATEPTSAASNLTFPLNKSYTLNGQFSAATGATKYLVLWSNGSPVTGVPVDGTGYLRGDVVGNAKVAYVGTATGFTPRGIIANQNYHFAIYPFNGSEGIENYYTSSPLTGSLTSGGEEIGSYYAGITKENSTFAADLKALVNPHTFISYYNYLQTMMNNFVVRDTTGGQSYVECAYSGHKELFPGNFTWVDANFSREHVFAHSWMPGNPYNGTPEHPAYTDQHNLLPTRYPGVNAVRSNFPFGEVITPESSYLDSKRGLDASNNVVYEPRDEIKGDVARALMYMAVTYNGTNSGIWAFPDFISFIIPYGQNADIIRQWHFQDLPDNYEIARNEYIYSVQGNRNPFIDSVNYACYIDFSNMNYNAQGCQLGLEQTVSSSDFLLFPVPAKGQVTIFTKGVELSGYEVLDLQGRVMDQKNNINQTTTTLNVEKLASGTYMVRLITPKGNALQKIVVE